MNNNQTWLIVLAFLFIFLYSQDSQTTSQTEFITNPNLIDGDVTFYGQDMYVKSLDIGTEYVRVFRFNDETKDLGYKSLSGGQLSTSPDSEYKFYFYMSSMPSSNYYISMMDYTGSQQDATDDILAKGCLIDKDLHFAALDPSDNIITLGSALSISTSEEKDITVRVKVFSDKCYGTPDAPLPNVICFAYDASYFQRVKAQSPTVSVPSSISAMSQASGKTLKCYQMALLKDSEFTEISVNILGHKDNDPRDQDDIEVFIDDIAFDLDASTLEEIWGYTDESGNQLGADAEHLGAIEIQ